MCIRCNALVVFVCGRLYACVRFVWLFFVSCGGWTYNLGGGMGESVVGVSYMGRPWVFLVCHLVGKNCRFILAAAAEAAAAAGAVYHTSYRIVVNIYFHVGKHLVARETHGSQLESSISTCVHT